MARMSDGAMSGPNSPHSNAEHEDDTDQLHDNDDKSRSGLRKKRIQQACRPCGIKRIKCDGAMPCATCVRAGEVCEYGQPKKRGPPKGSTRGGSKASKRVAAVKEGTAERPATREASRSLPAHQSTQDFGPMYSARNSGLPPLPPVDSKQWQRSSARPGVSNYSSEAAVRIGEGYRPDFRPPHVVNDRTSSFDPTESITHRYGPESFYRGGTSGHSFLRPITYSDSIGRERRLPALDFQLGRPSTSAASSPGRSDYLGHPDLSRSGGRPAYTYPRPCSIATSAAAAGSDPLYRDYYRSPAANPSSHNLAFHPSQQNVQPQPPPQTWAPPSSAHSQYPVARSAGPLVGQSTDNPLLVNGVLHQMHNDQRRKESFDSAARSDVAEDPVLDHLLWVESGDSHTSERLGITLNQPAIPLLIQERLFTIFWGIVQTIWPALYKPALCLTGFNIIDPEKHPMLHNAACALAAAAWDSGEAGLSEQDTEATQSDWVERTASDLTFSQGNLGSGANLQRLSAANLGDIFLVRAKYYLVKVDNEPSLEAIQSLLFMALREGGNGRASQASAYQSTACRMAIDLGLHRQRDFSSVLGLNFTHAEEQARSRIFWCLYLLDKTSSATLGRPVIMRDVDIDCPMPSIDEADEDETWAETTNNSSLIRDNARNRLLKTPIAAMTHLRSGVRLGQICEQVIGMYTEVKICKADAEDSWDVKVGKIHQLLEDWEQQLPHRLRFEEPAHRLPNTLCQHLWFQVCKVILHRPYILRTSNKPGLPSSHKVCTEAVGKICEILTAYEDNFGMRKLSSTFVYCIFTASTVSIANTTSTDPHVAMEAKRRLKKFMTWLNRISNSWKSATHHLQILEQLGHRIDADLDGTGLPSRTAVGPPAENANAMPGSPDEKPMMNNLSPSFSQLDTVSEQPDNGLPAHSVPGPIGAPMNLMRSRSNFVVGTAMQDDLQAQFHAQGQKPGQLFGLCGNVAGMGELTHRPTTSAMDAPPDQAAAAAAAAAFSGVGMPNVPSSGVRPPQISPGVSLRLHDTSYWGAMPLASEDTLSWANFTNSYLEALNGMTLPDLQHNVKDGDSGNGSGPDLNNLGAGAYGSGNLDMNPNLASHINVTKSRPQAALDYGSTM